MPTLSINSYFIFDKIFQNEVLQHYYQSMVEEISNRNFVAHLFADQDIYLIVTKIINSIADSRVVIIHRKIAKN